VAQQVETAQFFPSAVVGELTGELVCYARSVIDGEWPRMEAGVLGEQISPWGVELFRTLKTVQPETASEQAAYGKWLDQTSTREQARIDRVHGVLGVIPTPLWLMLLFVSVVIVVFMLSSPTAVSGPSSRRSSWEAWSRSSSRCCCCSGSSTIPTIPVSAAFVRWRWSGRWSFSTSSCASQTWANHVHATRAGARASAVSDQASNGRASGRPKRDWVEIVATLLLALAAVATAWSSYQATRWNGEQARAAGRTSAIRIQAARAASLAEAETQVDVATFMQWINADASKDTALADFYRKRFRQEFRPAFRAWWRRGRTRTRAPR
jgi:hypothetical protein